MIGKGLPWLIISQLFVTLGLIGFAYFQTDGTLKDLIVGAVIAHWINETPRLGQQVSSVQDANAATALAAANAPVIPPGP